MTAHMGQPLYCSRQPLFCSEFANLKRQIGLLVPEPFTSAAGEVLVEIETERFAANSMVTVKIVPFDLWKAHAAESTRSLIAKLKEVESEVSAHIARLSTELESLERGRKSSEERNQEFRDWLADLNARLPALSSRVFALRDNHDTALLEKLLAFAMRICTDDPTAFFEGGNAIANQTFARVFVDDLVKHLQATENATCSLSV